MTRTRSNPKSKLKPPITGVAAGSLGTAANLDDTQVMRTADLQAAAAGWLDDDAPVDAPDASHGPPEEKPRLEPVAPAAPVVASQPRPTARPKARRAPAEGPIDIAAVMRNRSAPAVAGVAALVMLLLIAGSGFVSQLNLDGGTGTGPEPSANVLIEAMPSPTAEPRETGKAHGKCHGRGHGNDCQGNQD